MFTRLSGFPRRTFLLAVLMFLFLFVGAQAALAVAPEFEKMSSDVAFQRPQRVVAADVDEDGYEDLLTTNVAIEASPFSCLAVSLSNGDGTFQTPVLYSLGGWFAAPLQFTVADLNGDSNLDAAVAIQNDNCIRVLLGNGDGTFQAAQTFGAGMSLPQDVAAGDFNGDEVIDLAVAKYDANTVAVLFGAGIGSAYSLGAPVYYSTGAGSYSITAGDFDGDNYLDLAVSNYSEYHLSILLNNGAGVFGTPSNYAVPCITEVICDDFNADGNPDLAAGGRDGVYVLTGNGDGTFASPVCYGSNSYYKSVTAGDFNGDSLIDLAALINRKEPSFIEPKLGVLTGNGDGTFQTEVTWYITPTGVYNQFFEGTLAAGDFNNDGKPDLAAANWDSIKTVSILLNTTPAAVMHTVSVSASPAEGGTVDGGGPYEEGASVTVTATSNAGYSFVNWTEGDVEVSTSAAYGFTMGAADRPLMANFQVATPPVMVSAARTDNTHITVTLSKNCVNLTKANNGGFTVEETGSPGTTYAVFSIAQGVGAGHVVLTVADMGVSAREGVTVKYTAGVNGDVQDTLGNAMLTDGTGVNAAAWDTTAPTITSGTLAATNAYIDITFSEGIYGAADGTTALTAAKLALTFTQIGGAATNVTISSVKQNNNAAEGLASALAGGETTVRVFLTITGTPNGVETIKIKPAGGASVYDKAGNAVLATQTTGAKTLNDKLAPTVTSVTVPAGGTYGAGEDLGFTVNFSEAVTVDTSGGTPCLQMTVGPAIRNALYVSGSGTASLLFRYTIQPSDMGGVTAGTLQAGGGTVKDAGGIDADLTLNNIGDTSNILVSQDIVLTSPGGGETWAAGSSQTINWNYTGNPGGAVRIELLQGGVLDRVISYGTYTGSDCSGSCIWPVPYCQAPGSDYRVRVTSILDNAYTFTSGAFTITLPLATSITVSSPNGGETWAAGSSQTISWNYNGSPGDLVKVELLKNWDVAKVINARAYIGLNGGGSCQWTVPSGLTAGGGYQVRVTSNLSNAYTDTSDDTFTVTVPQAAGITISSPNGGETWAAGSSQTIRWNYSGNIGQTVKVDLLKNDALDRVISYSTFTGSSGGGSCQWTVPQGLTAGSDYQVRVTTTSGAYTDTGDNAFTITGPVAPTITVTSPAGGESWAIGSSQTIRWRYTGNPGYLVRIELLKNDALNRVITYGAPIGSGGRGAYQWTVPRGLAAGNDYKIRVTSFSDSACTDTGDAAYSITP